MTSSVVNSPRALGVTIVVCCHNSAKRLPTTFGILKQRVPPQIEWEVLVIDNGSTDETGHVARGCWPSDAPTRLRIVREETLGLSRARKRGFLEATHEIVCFVDDDNWLCPAWVEIVSTVMGAHRMSQCVVATAWRSLKKTNRNGFADTLAASLLVHKARPGIPRGEFLGGWFDHSEIRVDATERGGFEQLLTDRQGGKLSSGGDTELCTALTRLGWKQWYEPALRLQHYIPASRARWEHLRRLQRGFGAASVPLSAYYCDPPDTWSRRLGSSWFW